MLTARLNAAASERCAILEQKEAACDGWHRASEALASCSAEKRALEQAAIPLEKQLASSRSKVAKLEAELKETAMSAQQAVRRVEETVALQARQLSDERSTEQRVERERGKLANVLAEERDRSQGFLEVTFRQQQQLAGQQQQQLLQQRRLHDEQAQAQHELYMGKQAVERDVAAAARSVAVAAAAASARERDSLLLTAGTPEAVTNHAMRAAVASKSLAEINELLDLQSSIRQGSADVQGALRSRHVHGILGAADGGGGRPSLLPPNSRAIAAPGAQPPTVQADAPAASSSAAAANALGVPPQAAPPQAAPPSAAPPHAPPPAMTPLTVHPQYTVDPAKRAAEWEAARAESLRALESCAR